MNKPALKPPRVVLVDLAKGLRKALLRADDASLADYLRDLEQAIKQERYRIRPPS